MWAQLIGIVLGMCLLPRAWCERGRSVPRWLRRAILPISRIAQRPWLAVTIVGLASLGLSALLSSLNRQPLFYHDEFTYQLAAETFAAGRLTNPAHPHAAHFEVPHVLQHPTYSSKFPPAQGLWMAAGLRLANDSLVGIWLSTACAAAALCWLFYAAVPRRIAFLAGLACGLHAVLHVTWGQSYCGGAVALMGGALTYGATLRLLQKPAYWHGLPLGCGVLLLANSRPLEGALAAIPAAVACLWAGRVSVREHRFAHFVKACLISVMILGFGGWGMAVHNQAVTGSPWVMPYQLHHATYASSPIFLFQQAWKQKQIDDPLVDRFFRDDAQLSWYAQQNRSRWLVDRTVLFIIYTSTFCLIVGGLLLLHLPWLHSRLAWNFLLPALVFCAIGSAQTTWFHLHYLAPIVPAGALVLVLIAAQLWSGNVTHRRRLLILACALICSTLYLPALWPRLRFEQWANYRARLQANLEAKPGQHLVLIHYSQDHHTFEEWAYNGPEIDHQKVIWAKARSPAENRALLNYFAGRTIWRLEPRGNQRPRFEPYPDTAVTKPVPPLRNNS